jgi:hypothetical protein
MRIHLFFYEILAEVQGAAFKPQYSMCHQYRYNISDKR